jgi:antitoxin CcdA
MSSAVYDATAEKKPTNVSINSDLLRQAREMKINLSATLEARLEEIIREERRRRWKEENKEAIKAYNEYIERHGGPVFEKYRTF